MRLLQVWLMLVLVQLTAFSVAVSSKTMLQVTDVNPQYLQGVGSVIILNLSGPVPEDSGLNSQIMSHANYVVLKGVRSNQDVDPNSVISVTKIYFLPAPGGRERRDRIVLELGGTGFIRGTIRVQDMTVGEDSIKGGTFLWQTTEYENVWVSASDFNLEFPNGTLVAAFSFSSASPWRFNSARDKALQQLYRLEGSVPITTPLDVQSVPGANVDASRIVADFVQLSYTDRTYNRAGNYTAWGLTVRTSGRLNGLEAVARYQPFADLFNDNRNFFGAEVEAGYRDGTSEWTNLTQPAPFRGNLVARLGTVIEWAPQLGPVNLDLTSGLRFFVRGRGWADYAKNDTGQDGVRFRGFLDSELFYDINSEYRVFLRYELGSLPPDLTRSVSTVMIGIGASF